MTFAEFEWWIKQQARWIDREKARDRRLSGLRTTAPQPGVKPQHRRGR